MNRVKFLMKSTVASKILLGHFGCITFRKWPIYSNNDMKKLKLFCITNEMGLLLFSFSLICQIPKITQMEESTPIFHRKALNSVCRIHREGQHLVDSTRPSRV